jgi:hypothetical protein
MSELIKLDAKTFQKPLIELAETLAQKVKREAPKLLPAPGFVPIDLHILMRQAMYTYDLLFYLNADERRQRDCYWRPAYGIVVLPVVRSMIDCLYNITLILQDPTINGPWFRKSGFKKVLAALDEDEARYGGRPEWDEWIKKGRDQLSFAVRQSGLTLDDVLSEKPWPTLGKYIRDKGPGGSRTRHQDFLENFTLVQWREYSAIGHAAVEGLLPIAVYLASDSLPHEDRPKLDEVYPIVMCKHLSRAAGVLLCIITELQAYFHFAGANINERINRVWNALTPSFEIKELYTDHYQKLMEDKGILL